MAVFDPTTACCLRQPCYANSPHPFPQETNGTRHLRKVHANKKVSTQTQRKYTSWNQLKSRPNTGCQLF